MFCRKRGFGRVVDTSDHALIAVNLPPIELKLVSKSIPEKSMNEGQIETSCDCKTAGRPSLAVAPIASSQVESSQVESSQVESSQVESSQVESSQVESSQVESSHIVSGHSSIDLAMQI
jgi:magnesium chelatase family protein